MVYERTYLPLKMNLENRIKRQTGYIPRVAAYRKPGGGCAMIFPYAGKGEFFSVTEKERTPPTPQAGRRPMDGDSPVAMICM